MQTAKKIIGKVIYFGIIITLLFVAYRIYSINNFNEYIRAEYNSGITNFVRDESVKYSKMNSYKIENTDYNDAMFFKTISVKPNTSYRVSCMVKTQDVVNKEKETDAGAHICINESVEKSDNVIGTSDWTKLEFIFNSKNREQLDIGFRLGGNYDNSKGIAWFSDMQIEAGVADTSNNWNFICLIFDKTNVEIDLNGKTTKFDLTLTQEDVEDMKACIYRFKDSMRELSKGKMTVSYDVVEVKQPITSMSHDEENGYYVAPYNVKDIIEPYIKMGKYDHIFVAFRTGNITTRHEIPVNDWIGLRTEWNIEE